MKYLIQKLSNSFNKIFFPFYSSKDVKHLFQKLEVGEQTNKEVAMFVGGCVRNYLGSKKIKDIDIATILTPEQIKKKLENSEFKVVDTGIDHGSVTIVSKTNSYELTTLRKDLNTDGRHADIKIIDDWNEDSKRRDFTINSIYLNKKGKIFDPQQGVKDLENQTVKFIGDPQTRIEEDYLRIIRFIRFAIQYDAEIEPTTVKAIKLNLNGVKSLSKERVLTELLKILNLKNFYKLIDKKELLDIFKLIFPEFENLKRLQKFYLIQNYIEISPILFLAIMLVDNKNNYEYFCHKYNVSNKISDQLNLLGSKFKDFDNDKEFFKKKLKINLYYMGSRNLKKMYCLHLLDKKKFSINEINILKTIEKMTAPKFPYDGKFLINKGFKEGKKLGEVLNEIENAWVQNNFDLSNAQLEEIIKKFT